MTSPAKSRTTMQQQTQDPWGPASPYLQALLPEAQSLYQSDIGYQPWMGPVNADISPQTQSGLSGLQAYASDPNNQAQLGKVIAANADIAQGNQLTNPFLQQQMNAANANIQDRINAQFSGAGRYGSGDYAKAIASGMAESNANLMGRAYDAARQQQMQAIQGMPAMYQMGTLPYQTMGQVGSFYDQRAQNDLNNVQSVWNQSQARPWEMLGRVQNAYQGLGGMGGTIQGYKQTPGPSGLQQRLGIAQSALGLLGMF